MTTQAEQITSQERRSPAQIWAARLVSGAVAGAVAAVPMALLMSALNRYLPGRKQSFIDRLKALPPKKITQRVTRRAGLGFLTRPGKGWESTTWLAHLGYGAATASLYPVITRPLPLPGILRGMLFAIGVWAGSYLGWLPAVNILPPATKQSPRRNAVMILSHLFWGSLIALMSGWLTRRISGREADYSI